VAVFDLAVGLAQLRIGLADLRIGLAADIACDQFGRLAEIRLPLADLAPLRAEPWLVVPIVHLYSRVPKRRTD
jgi:hypothetical protein